MGTKKCCLCACPWSKCVPPAPDKTPGPIFLKICRDGSASMTLCLKNNHRSSVRLCTDHNDNPEDNASSAHAHRHPHHHHNRHPHDNSNSSSHHPQHPPTQAYLDNQHHQHYFKEEWKWFEHVEQWDDFNYRNGQMYKRAEECTEVLNILTDMNGGVNIHNTLGLSFNTQHFKGRLDLTRVSLVGHSFGGSTCIATLASEPRFKVGVVLDGWMHPVDDGLPAQVKQPALMVNLESFQWKKNIQQMLALQHSTQADRPMITIRGTCHQSVTDFQFLCNLVVGRVMEVRYKLDPELCMDMACKATLGFLYKHLGMEDKPHYEDILSGEHPLIIPGTNVDLS